MTRRLLAAVLLAAALLAPAGARAAGTYVALGDSYAAGLGAGGAPQGGACRRSPDAYPARAAASLPGLRLDTRACSGATTTDVLAGQVPAVTPAARLVTVTAGGNDAGFASVMVGCALAPCGPAVAAAARLVRSLLPARLDALYRAVRARAPAARVLVLGYPRLFGPLWCPGAAGFSTMERGALNALADALDAVLAARAAAAGVRYRSTIGAFAAHGVCSPDPWLHGLDPWHPSWSFHPTRTGQARGYAPLVGP